MDYEKRVALTKIAKQVAADLMAELKAGKIYKIGIDEIERAIILDHCPRYARDFDTLSEMATRCVVESVG